MQSQSLIKSFFCGPTVILHVSFVLLPIQQKCKQNTNFYGAVTRERKIIGGWHFQDCLKTKSSFWASNLTLRNAPLNKKLKLPLTHSICSVNWLPVFLISLIKLWLVWDPHLAQLGSNSLRLDSYTRKVLSSQVYFSPDDKGQKKFSVTFRFIFGWTKLLLRDTIIWIVSFHTVNYINLVLQMTL